MCLNQRKFGRRKLWENRFLLNFYNFCSKWPGKKRFLIEILVASWMTSFLKSLSQISDSLIPSRLFKPSRHLFEFVNGSFWWDNFSWSCGVEKVWQKLLYHVLQWIENPKNSLYISSIFLGLTNLSSYIVKFQENF